MEIIHTMKDIKKEDWNSLVKNDKVEISHEWFSFTENVGMKPGFNYCHVLHTEQGKPVTILPAYHQPLNLNTIIRGYKPAFVKILLDKIKVPLSITKSHIPLSCDFRILGNAKYFSECLAKLDEFSKKQRHFYLVVRDSNDYLDLPRFFCRERYPEVLLNSYSSWDAYLEDQPGKRAKNIRYEYKKSVKAGTKTYMVEDLEDYNTILHTLLMNVCQVHLSFVKYPKHFFKTVKKYVPAYARCLCAEYQGDITAFLFFLENKHFISCKYAGRDYTAEDSYVYFRLMYDLIKHAAKVGKPISMEKVSYEAKLRRGFKIQRKKDYVKLYFPVIKTLYTPVLHATNDYVTKYTQKLKMLESE
ncbi:MAG: GNAT family N-acetyltransferase [Candidatus Methanofastidiosia archaeon]|jgi:predicted N-acyltransferase